MNGWSQWREEWTIPEEVTYLNHGSFGPSPRVVQEERCRWYRRLESQPMNFFLRELEDRLNEARRRLGEFVGAAPEQLALVDNATFGVNVVARTFARRLGPGDEVLLSNHEYGAVKRLWEKTCGPLGAKVVEAEWPLRPQSPEELVERLLERVGPRTRLIVVSHVTSPTALVVPVEQICREAARLGVPVCVDGPHAPVCLPLNIHQLGCAFYAASCHKWLCAPFGSGFLYVADEFQDELEPAVVSWGTNAAGRPPSWQDEFNWVGTRDVTPFVAIPSALDFLQQLGVERFREYTGRLMRVCRELLQPLGLKPLVPDAPSWQLPMLSFELPKPRGLQPQVGAQRDPLQLTLWERFKIEVIVPWHGSHRLLRPCCHFYNSVEDFHRLAAALKELLS